MKAVFLPLLIISSASILFSQAPPALTAAEIVDRAASQRSVYIGEFRNLISQETKSFEIYDKKGALKKRRVVESNFLVYQLSRDEKRISEFRNVIAVDGRQLNSTEKRTGDLFESIAKLESSQKELDKIQEESTRFDEEVFISDLTLFQAVTLAENMRPYFEFRLRRIDNSNGAPVYVLSYRQTKASPYVYTDLKKQPRDGRLSVYYDIGRHSRRSDAAERLSGELWIDARTFQVRREVREFTLTINESGAPLKIAETVFEFQSSDFGILTPRTITHTQFRTEPDEISGSREAVVTFAYEKFSKPNVEVRSSDVKH